MKRAIPFLLTLAAAGPAACSSSGSSPGSAYVVLEPSQSSPSDSQEAVFNPNGPSANSEQPPANPDSPPFSTAPAGQGFDACPLLCGHVDSRCASRCAETCTIYNLLAGTCPGELSALFACVGNNGGLTCNDNGRLTLAQGLCTAEIEAAVPCIQRFSDNPTPSPTATVTRNPPGPGPTGIANPPPPSSDGGL